MGEEREGGLEWGEERVRGDGVEGEGRKAASMMVSLKARLLLFLKWVLMRWEITEGRGYGL